MDLDILVGSGGVLSHAPRRHQSARMMIDSFLPEGITQIAVDSIFMMPQLGVLSAVHEKAATEVFNKDCLLRLGICVAPVGPSKPGKEYMRISFTLPDGKHVDKAYTLGEMELFEAPYEAMEAEITPARGVDVGSGPGQVVKTTIYGGLVGVIIDARGRRPFVLPEDPVQRVAKLQEWSKIVNEFEDK